MRRWWPVVPAIALLVVGAVPSRLQYALQKSLQNEREAVAKYEACAVKADEEGYPGAAALFRAAARAEGIHAERITRAMRDRGLTIPEPMLEPPTIAETAANLRSSASAETTERDTTYREALDAATDARETALVTMFDQTRDTEVEHANLFNTANRQLEKLKQSKHYFVCGECGYTTDVDLPLCALCRVREHPRQVK